MSVLNSDPTPVAWVTVTLPLSVAISLKSNDS